MRRSNAHVGWGLAFIGMAVLIAAFIYLGFSAASSVQPATDSPAENVMSEHVDNSLVEVPTSSLEVNLTEEQVVPAPSALPPNFRQYLVDRYYSEVAGENAQCNGSIWSFEPDGTFEITAVANGEITRGRWALGLDHLSLTQISITDMDTQAVRSEGDADVKISWHDGILIIGSVALYSCHL